MMHSQYYYNSIREKMKEDISLEELDDLISAAKLETPTAGSIINTFEHLWGYFKNICSPSEKQQYKLLKSQFCNDDIDKEVLIQFISVLTKKYKVKYLENSTLLTCC